MRLVEEEDQLRLVRISDFGQTGEQFGQQPEQEGRIEIGAADQLFRFQDMDEAAPVDVGLEQVHDVERRLAEEFFRALVLQHQQLPLDRADRGRRDIAVALLEVGGVLRHEGQHGAQVFQVEQGQALLVGDAEDDIEHAFLDLVELEDARQQQRPHFGDGGADRMALFAEQIPEHAAELVGLISDADFLRPRDKRLGAVAGHGDPGQVALDVGGEDAGSGDAETFGELLQGHGLARSGRAGDQPVAVAVAQQQIDVILGLADEDFAGDIAADRTWIRLFDSDSARRSRQISAPVRE